MQIIHKAKDGGYREEAPALPAACRSETIREITKNIREAIAGYLSVSVNQTAEGSRAG
jgi:hypothetical protein